MWFDRAEFRNFIGFYYSGEGFFPKWPPDTVLDVLTAAMWTLAFGWLVFPMAFLGSLRFC